MTALSEQFVGRFPKRSATKLEQQLRDYVSISNRLIWQRQAIFLSATLLAAFYIDSTKAFVCYSAVLVTELLDMILARSVSRWSGGTLAAARRYLWWVILNTILSAAAICTFIVMIALQQAPGDHFTPLFFLFAAALFAAMNNHQLLPALGVRLCIYGSTFLFITLLDIWTLKPPLTSELWLQFFTVVFVMYFIIDCSFVYLGLYRQGYRQLEDLRTEHDKALAAFRVKTRFIATVSHELRTPLTSIKGSLDLINTGKLGETPAPVSRMLQIAGQNSERLASLIDDVLDIQKIEAGEMKIRLDPIDVRQLLEEAIDANRGYAQSFDVNVVLDERLDPEETAWIRGEKGRLMQAMNNLISNATKFSDKGGVVKVGYDESDFMVRIWVRDWGIGIPENSHDKVFGQFIQIDSSDLRRTNGTGLGMNITKQIVEMHDGTVDYESELGEGTTFYLKFPGTHSREPQKEVSNEPVAIAS